MKLLENFVEYGIACHVSGARGKFVFYTVHPSRQSKHIARSFHEVHYGSEVAAYRMATTYRDAVIRLLPPQSQRQRVSRLNSRNRSGISGVLREEQRGKPYWIATLTTSDRKHSQSFSIARYGEELAKAKAIQAREHLILQHPDYFITGHAIATRTANTVFNDLLQSEVAPLEEPLSIISPEQMETRLGTLQSWFDALLPKRVYVRMTVYTNKRSKLNMVVSGGGHPAKLHSKGFSLEARSLSDTLLVAWEALKQLLTDLHGEECWQLFSRAYQEEFFAFTCDQCFHVSYPWYGAGYANLRNPPPELAELLPGFKVPAIEKVPFKVQREDKHGK